MSERLRMAALSASVLVVALAVTTATALAEPADGSKHGETPPLAEVLEAVGGAATGPTADGVLLTAQATCDGTRQAFLEVVGEQAVRSYLGDYDNDVEYNGWNGEPWCGHFIAWCARVAGVSEDHIPAAGTAKSVPRLASWFSDRGRYHNSDGGYDPKAGDVAFLDGKGHVGVVVGRSGSDVIVKEGNVGDGGANDEVQVNTYWKSGGRICGYGETDMPERNDSFDFGPNVTLPAGDGTYTICSTLDKRLYLEVAGGLANDGGNVQLWPGDGDEPQRRWVFTRNDDGTYTIWRYGTNKVLDVSEISRDDEANVQIWESVGSDNQRWYVQDCGNGVYALKAKHSGKFLDVAGGGTADGTNVWQWHGHDRDGFGHSQKFIIAPSYGPSSILPRGGGPQGVTYTIAALSDPGSFVEVAGGGKADGDNVQLWAREDEPQRRWDFWRNDDGTYTIWRYGTNKVLDISEASLADGANVQIWECVGVDNQHWWVEDCGDGVYALKAKHSGKFLDMAGGSAAKGTNIQQWQGNLTDAQRFLISPSYGYSVELPQGDGAYEIVPALDGSLVLGIDGASPRDGGQLVLARPSGGTDQRFDFRLNADGTYTITALHSVKALDVSSSSRSSCARVQQWVPTGANNQRWWVEDLGGGRYALKSKHSGKFLDVRDGAAREQQEVWQYEGNGSAAQQFLLRRLTLDDATVDAVADQAPTGSAVEPALTVRFAGRVLEKGRDYEVVWSDNVWPGTARATLTGAGGFSGSLEVEFRILDLSKPGWVDLGDGAKGYASGGRLVTGWMDLGSSKFYFDERGRMLKGWQDVDVSGKAMRYYFNPSSGNLARGTWMTIDGKKYYFRASGNVAHGWATIPDNGVDKKYYFDDSHQMVTGWREIEVNGRAMHYYFRPSGAMATGWATIDGEKYWFRASGNMATGFADVGDGYKRYFDEFGHMLTGWQSVGGKTYYFRVPSGAMQTGKATIDGVAYEFTSSGTLRSGASPVLSAQDEERIVSLRAEEDLVTLELDGVDGGAVKVMPDVDNGIEVEG